MAKGNKKTVTHSADPATTAMQNSTYDAAKAAANGYTTPDADPATLQAMGLFGDVAKQGGVGAAALGGDTNAISRLMNPYLSNVLGGYEAQFGNDSALLRKNTNDAATRAGAFGGDRAALEQGAQQGQLATSHLQQVADLLRGGYNDAMGRAGALSNLGMSAGNALFQGGDYLRGIASERANPALMRAKILAEGLKGGNVGNYSDTTYSRTSALQNILGAAATGASLFGGGGGIGALLSRLPHNAGAPMTPTQMTGQDAGKLDLSLFAGY